MVENAPNKLFVPLHYVVTDATGASIIIEFVNGETNVYGSTNGVMTNAPTLSCVDLEAIDSASMPGYGDGTPGSTCSAIQILPPQDSIAPWSVDVTNQFSPVPA